MIPRCIVLPYPPLVSVESITYLDSSDVEQTWSDTDYDVATYAEPGYVVPSFNEDLPSDFSYGGTVSYTAGYGTEFDDLLPSLQILVRMVTHYYRTERGGAPMEAGIENLIMAASVGEEFVEYPN